MPGPEDRSYIDKTLAEGLTAEELEKLQSAAAKERQEELGKTHGDDPCGKFPQGGKTRDKVAATVGVSGKTYEKAKAVYEAAEQEVSDLAANGQLTYEHPVYQVYQRLLELVKHKQADAAPEPSSEEGHS